MIEIFDLDTADGFHDNMADYEKICEISFMPNIHDVLHIDESYYSVCRVKPHDYVGVRKIDYDPEQEDFETYEYDFTCPYCGYVDVDAFELPDNDEDMKCGRCGAKLEYEREIIVQYRVSGIEPPNIIEVQEDQIK